MAPMIRDAIPIWRPDLLVRNSNPPPTSSSIGRAKGRNTPRMEATPATHMMPRWAWVMGTGLVPYCGYGAICIG